MQKKKVLKLSLSGGNAVGKSSIAARLVRKEPDLEYNPTIGVDYFALSLPSYKAKIGIWDLAGNRRFESLTIPYINRTNIRVYVYDLTRSESVNELISLHTIYEKYSSPKNFKVIVVGNKKDKEPYNDCMLQGEKFANDLKAPHIIVSAKTNRGIDELLSVIINEVNLDIEHVNVVSDIKISMRTCECCNIL
jgi:small GTP-binding protein